jgi:hypothetical protein
MIRKLTLVAAFGAGYVLGAKAGKERYEQITAGLQSLASKPAVAKATDAATAKAADLSGQAKDKAAALAGDAVETVKDKVGGSHEDDVVDLRSTTHVTTSGPTT